MPLYNVSNTMNVLTKNRRPSAGSGRGSGASFGVVAPDQRTVAQLQAAASWVFSVRKVIPTYAGPCIKVRRESDNTTLDIGFDVNGWLDTTALATFTAATNGRVDTWYDQSASALHVTQAATGQQPQCSLAGVAYTLANGRPTLNWQVGNTIGLAHATGVPKTDNCSMFAVAEKSGIASANSVCILAGSSGAFAVRYGANTTSPIANALQFTRAGQYTQDAQFSVPVGLHAVGCTVQGNTGTMMMDALQSSSNSLNMNLTQNVRCIGARFTTIFVDGFANQAVAARLPEVLYWNQALTFDDLTILRAEAQTVFGTP